MNFTWGPVCFLRPLFAWPHRFGPGGRPKAHSAKHEARIILIFILIIILIYNLE
jgi:hypothetical protein